MDPIAVFVTNIAAGILSNFSTDAIRTLFQTAVGLKPSISQTMEAAKTTRDVERIFREAVDVIDAQAGTGSINFDGALLEALRGIRFNHARGTVRIGNTTVKAQVINTGGGPGATGTTTIEGKTRLESKGTRIDLGKGAEIRVKGNAQIKQT